MRLPRQTLQEARRAIRYLLSWHYARRRHRLVLVRTMLPRRGLIERASIELLTRSGFFFFLRHGRDARATGGATGIRAAAPFCYHVDARRPDAISDITPIMMMTHLGRISSAIFAAREAADMASSPPPRRYMGDF